MPKIFISLQYRTPIFSLFAEFRGFIIANMQDIYPIYNDLGVFMKVTKKSESSNFKIRWLKTTLV